MCVLRRRRRRKSGRAGVFVICYYYYYYYFFASLQRLILPIHTHLTRLGWWVGRGADEAAGDVCIAVEMCHWVGVAGWMAMGWV